MPTIPESDPWAARLQFAACLLKQPSQNIPQLLRALYALREPLQEGPDFDALERVFLECNWLEPDLGNSFSPAAQYLQAPLLGDVQDA
jgi:hypothetical protein